MKVTLNVDARKAELEELAKQTRDTLEIADIEWPAGSGQMWQVRAKDRSRMLETINGAAILGVPPETTARWILADNSTRETTAQDLQQVLVAYALRMQAIFNQYTDWRAGSRTRPFQFV